MSYLHYDHIRARERSPYIEDEEPFYARPLIRRNSKRQRVDIFDDDEFDDYPSAKPSQPSRALTIRQPSQLTKYNVYNDGRDRHHDSHDHHSHRNKHVHKYYVTRPSESDNEREFQLKVKATLSRPKSSHAEKAMAWSGDMFRRKEKWERVDWESRERGRRDSFFDDEPIFEERDIKYRKIKRTRTDEWKPLSGWKRV